MAGNISNYLENKLLDHSLGTTEYTFPATVYVALFTSDPTDAGSGTECSGTSYARQACDFDAAANGATANTAAIEFPVAGGSWGTITHVGIYDALEAGNLLWHGALTASKAIGTSDQFKIAAGDLDVSLD